MGGGWLNRKGNRRRRGSGSYGMRNPKVWAIIIERIIKEPLNKPESSAIRLLLPLSLLDFPKALRILRGLVQKFLNCAGS